MHPVQATKYTTYACVERNGCKIMIGYYGVLENNKINLILVCLHTE